MSTCIIKDHKHNIVGVIQKNSTNTLLYDKNHKYLGKYHNNLTYNQNNQIIGSHNQLLKLLPK